MKIKNSKFLYFVGAAVGIIGAVPAMAVQWGYCKGVFKFGIAHTKTIYAGRSYSDSDTLTCHCPVVWHYANQQDQEVFISGLYGYVSAMAGGVQISRGREILTQISGENWYNTECSPNPGLPPGNQTFTAEDYSEE